jgi:hypothetical protein
MRYLILVWILSICTIIFSDCVFAQQTELMVYPEKLNACDPIYVALRLTNNTDNAMEFVLPDLTGEKYGSLGKLEIISNQSIKRIVPTVYSCPPEIKSFQIRRLVTVQPKTTLDCPLAVIFLPDLDELHDVFWESLPLNKKQDGQTFEIRLSYIESTINPQKLSLLSACVNIRNRKYEEYNKIENWYKKTHASFFPEPYERKIILNNTSYYIRLKIISEAQKNLLNNDTYNPISFFRICNSYLCNPNRPKDWEDWKNLEESCESSTLRDEIRWTRICIQYCSTGDEKVLDELKTWFEKMNPIQRTVMVNNYFGYDEKLPNSKKLYETIQSFKDKK